MQKVKWIRVSRRNLCPVCGKPDWCLISQDGNAVICARTQNNYPVGNSGAGWLHRLNSGSVHVFTTEQQPQISPLAKHEVLNTVYQSLLNKLSLSAAHRLQLNQRGLNDDQIYYLNYKTFPGNSRQEIIANLVNEGMNLSGVPGFYYQNGRWQLAGRAGIAIPIKDIKKRIIGIQIRCDNTVNGKYKWLSSRGFNQGCSPGTPVHLAGRITFRDEIWITEGPIKADIASLKLGRTILAVPGVSNWRGVIPIIKSLQPQKVIVAYDMDKITNHIVRFHCDELISYLIKQRIRTFEADWNPAFKGIDDLLTFGGQTCQR